MKRISLILIALFGFIVATRAQTNLIEWQTNWPVGGSNDLCNGYQQNLPTSSAWYTGTKTLLLGVSNGVTTNLVATDQSGSSSLTWWTYFAPALVDTNNPSPYSLETNGSNPIQLSPGTTIQVTVNFSVTGAEAQNVNRHLRFGLFYSGTNGNFTGGGNPKNDYLTGYGQNMNFGTTFAEAPFSAFADTNSVDGKAIISTTTDQAQIGANGGGTTNDPGFIDGTNYTMVFSVTENSPTNVSITTTFIGFTLTNGMITQTVTDTNYCYTNFDTFVMRLNDGATTATNWVFTSFQVVTFNTLLGSPTITESLSGGNLSLSWPPDYIGWQLESQSNTLNAANWVIVAGSSTTNKVVIPVNMSAGAAFFRLISPP